MGVFNISILRAIAGSLRRGKPNLYINSHKQYKQGLKWLV